MPNEADLLLKADQFTAFLCFCIERTLLTYSWPFIQLSHEQDKAGHTAQA
jgi:hypothetical protein